MIYESDYYVGSDLNGDSLSHHGVPKQKWGVRNGPPYPVRRGSEVHYNVGKMTDKTKESFKKAGKIVGGAAKSAGSKIRSSFKKWAEEKKTDLATKPTDSALLKNWQKKQLRISDMTNQELQQRIDRKKLEATYKHALRGDFSDPKTWKKGGSGDKGKQAADGILRKFGDAAIEGLTKGLSAKIEQTMVSKAKARNARKEAARDMRAEVLRDAARERAEYRAEQRNANWKAKQDRKSASKQERQKQKYRDSMNRARTGNAIGSLGSGNSRDYYYYTSPGEWTIT